MAGWLIRDFRCWLEGGNLGLCHMEVKIIINNFFFLSFEMCKFLKIDVELLKGDKLVCFYL